jgi:hypothetical protein
VAVESVFVVDSVKRSRISVRSRTARWWTAMLVPSGWFR